MRGREGGRGRERESECEGERDSGGEGEGVESSPALRGGDTPGSLLFREYRSSGRWSRYLPDRP